MSNSAQQKESISRIALWPIWLAGRYFSALLVLSFLCMVLAVGAYRLKIEVDSGEGLSPISPLYMSNLNDKSLAYSANPDLSRTLSQSSYFVYFKLTGIHRALISNSNNSSNSFVGNIPRNFPNDLAMAMLAIQLFGIRLGNLILLTPFILIVLTLATIDGLAAREIRRETAGNESAGTHQLTRKIAFRFFPPVLALLYLGLPLDLSPDAVFVPAMAVMAVLVRTKWKFYQKYF